VSGRCAVVLDLRRVWDLALACDMVASALREDSCRPE
jgi:hypothetical protein